ncbi:MAG: antitoxin [Pseudonocardiaceae bacterium]
MIRKLAALAGVAEAARRYATKNPDKVSKLADQAGRFVDQRTKGRYHSQIDGAVRKVKNVGLGTH